MKLVMVGDAGTGKTSLCNACAGVVYREGSYMPAVFDNYLACYKVGDLEVSVGIWDTSGMGHYKRLRPLSYPCTSVFLVLFSVVSPPSFENVKVTWNPELSHYAPGVPKILVGTKTDLREDQNTVNALK
eukprot:CAMPEP_0174268808 /NCGR_PEP_ID=MMETSP0439-20130205/38780_1 /TAXON_ID=0 /ORGANISM="Stereomyxa ramosa, Strain Chinc5" /LENGTH=128 /DNA_ID=CAMNT_0015357213 /DNA_START=42 /DNA_END=425 /DNA_ORIENTATION=-